MVPPRRVKRAGGRLDAILLLASVVSFLLMAGILAAALLDG